MLYVSKLNFGTLRPKMSNFSKAKFHIQAQNIEFISTLDSKSWSFWIRLFIYVRHGVMKPPKMGPYQRSPLRLLSGQFSIPKVYIFIALYSRGCPVSKSSQYNLTIKDELVLFSVLSVSLFCTDLWCFMIIILETHIVLSFFLSFFLSFKYES